MISLFLKSYTPNSLTSLSRTSFLAKIRTSFLMFLLIAFAFTRAPLLNSGVIASLSRGSIFTPSKQFALQKASSRTDSSYRSSPASLPNIVSANKFSQFSKRLSSLVKYLLSSSSFFLNTSWKSSADRYDKTSSSAKAMIGQQKRLLGTYLGFPRLS